MQVRFTIVLLAAGAFLACTEAPTGAADVDSPLFSTAGQSGPSASGHTNLTIEGGLQTFSFNARQKKDGTVTGTLQVKSRGQNTTVHGNIDCLTVSGNQAFLNGVVTKANADNPFNIAPDDRLYFGVEDNGEGAGAPADAWTDVFVFGSDATCLDPGLALIANEGGNIQVKP